MGITPIMPSMVLAMLAKVLQVLTMETFLMKVSMLMIAKSFQDQTMFLLIIERQLDGPRNSQSRCEEQIVGLVHPQAATQLAITQQIALHTTRRQRECLCPPLCRSIGTQAFTVFCMSITMTVSLEEADCAMRALMSSHPEKKGLSGRSAEDM